MIKVYLPDGAALELSDGANCLDAAKAISAGLARAAFAAEVDGKAVELMTPLTDGAHIAILTSGDDALHMMRHTASHVLAQAVQHLYRTPSLPSARQFPPAFTTISIARLFLRRRI